MAGANYVAISSGANVIVASTDGPNGFQATISGKIYANGNASVYNLTTRQGNIHIGLDAGDSNQASQSIAIGGSAGKVDQYQDAVAIGTFAGYERQGSNSIAIGKTAGNSFQPNNSIILNATGDALNTTIANTFIVKPIRRTTSGNMLYYNSTTGEISYQVLGATLAQIANGTSNINIPTTNGNILVTVANVANITTFTSTGINSNGYITAVGNITANVFFGNASGLTYIPGPNVNGVVPNAANATLATTANYAYNANLADNANVANVANYITVSNANANSNIAMYPTFVSATGNAVLNLDNAGNSIVYYPDQAKMVFGTADVDYVINGSGEIIYLDGTNHALRMSVSGLNNAFVVSNSAITVNTSNANLGNAARANYFIGDGSLLSNVNLVANTLNLQSLANVGTTYYLVLADGTGNKQCFVDITSPALSYYSGGSTLTVGALNSSKLFGSGQQIDFTVGSQIDFSAGNSAPLMTIRQANVQSFVPITLARRTVAQANALAGSGWGGDMIVISDVGNIPAYYNTSLGRYAYVCNNSPV